MPWQNLLPTAEAPGTALHSQRGGEKRRESNNRGIGRSVRNRGVTSGAPSCNDEAATCGTDEHRVGQAAIHHC